VSLEEVLLRDVLANPADDTPRRIYADWLMDQADPHQAAHGELIHIQCERAARPPNDPELLDLVAAERELLAAHQHAWGGPLAGLVERWEYRRGFPEGVTLTARVFLDHAAALFSQGPIHELRLREATWLLAELATSRYLAAVTLLDLRDNEIDWLGLAELTQSRHAGRLAVLDLSRNRLGVNGVQALRGTVLPALKTLRLNGSPLGPAGAEALVMALSYPSETGEPGLGQRLTTLEVADCGLGSVGAQTFCFRCPSGVRELDLSRNGLGAGGAQALAGRYGYGLRQLHRLNLSGNDLGPAGAEALRPVLTHGHSPGPTGIGLSHNGLGDEGVEGFTPSYGSWRLTEMALAGNGISPRGAQALVEMCEPGRLTRLDLDRNELGAEGASVLASSPNLATLTDLDLGHNRLGPAGVENLLASLHLTNLKRLVLRGNGIGGRGVRALLAAPHLDGLIQLDVSGNKLDAQDVQRLRARFGARVRA
jgi:uncharacterized protein (TIGR02996 family)